MPANLFVGHEQPELAYTHFSSRWNCNLVVWHNNSHFNAFSSFGFHGLYVAFFFSISDVVVQNARNICTLPSLHVSVVVARLGSLYISIKNCLHYISRHFAKAFTIPSTSAVPMYIAHSSACSWLSEAAAIQFTRAVRPTTTTTTSTTSTNGIKK